MTEQEYEDALKEIQALMNCEPNTPDERRLNDLVQLVMEYERANYPMD